MDAHLGKRITTRILRVFDEEGQRDPGYRASALFGLAIRECIRAGQSREEVLAFVHSTYDASLEILARLGGTRGN